MVKSPERRCEPRRTPATPELRRVRVRAGLEAQMLDWTPRSVCLATLMRLLPGRRCSLSWPSLDATPSANGIVLRCHVGLLEPIHGVHYHAVVLFDGAASFLWEAATREG